MADDALVFSESQWQFLAILEAIPCPVTYELAGKLTPLMPGPLMDLLVRAEAAGWINRIGDDLLALGENLPQACREKLDAINRPEHLADLIDRIEIVDSSREIAPTAKVSLLRRAGRQDAAGRIEIELAREAMVDHGHEAARRHLLAAAADLAPFAHERDIARDLIQSTLLLSNISFAMGQGLAELEPYLLTAQEASSRHGDRRSQALLNLHHGGVYYFINRRDDALVALSMGFEEIEDLGDDDILSQSAAFLGVYYFIKGLLREAAEHFDRTERLSDDQAKGVPAFPLAPVFGGYCAVYLGHFHRAVGILDYAWRLALERNDHALAANLRAVLGTVLVLIGKEQQGIGHLQQALKAAARFDNAFASYLANGGLAVHAFRNGRIEQAYETLKATIVEGNRAGLVRQFSSPWVLEMLHAFHRRGFAAIPGMEYTEIAEQILAGINVHLMGVALRLRAADSLDAGNTEAAVDADLAASEKCLRQAGDPVQLSKTLIEMARRKRLSGLQAQAQQHVQQARRLLGGYFDDFFPQGSLSGLESPQDPMQAQISRDDLLDGYLEMIESLYPMEGRKDILAKILSATSRMFNAERAAIFRFASQRQTAAPEPQAILNLSSKDIAAGVFGPSIALVRRAFETDEALTDSLKIKETALGKRYIRSVLCIPVEADGLVQYVLYYDTAYLETAFAFLDLPFVKRMSRHTHVVVERRLAHIRAQDQINRLTSEQSLRTESVTAAMIFQSPEMTRVVSRVDQVAATESTVLLLGETGTGKELVAKHLHGRSLRVDGPFITVDATTIPDSLLESELFGHEKGAFTGADRRKIGRIELAHKGTLFLDEVGELTLSAQAKLLRALQERTFHRVGGIRTIQSDFRLVGATNRDLEAEVSAGRFREDLYYRLNVIPVRLPKLADRKDDIVLLAEHFAAHDARRYNRAVPALSSEDKAALRCYPWPGNVRELKNVIERAIILSSSDRFDLNLPTRSESQQVAPFKDKPSLDEIQRRYILHVIEQTDGKISGPGGACEILGMKRTSLYSRMKALGLSRSHNKAG